MSFLSNVSRASYQINRAARTARALQRGRLPQQQVRRVATRRGFAFLRKLTR